MPDTDIRDLASGDAIIDTDLFISRQDVDIVDVSVTALQIKTHVLASPAITGVATAGTIQATTSAGLILESNSGGDVLHIGNGSGVNATAYGGWNFDGATADTIASFGASKTLTSLSTATYPSLTELSYVKGVTSAIQTQLNAKIGGSSGATDNAIIRADGTGGATVQTSSLLIDDSGNITGPAAGFKITGGTGTTADLSFQTTSGVGASGADMHFLVGNNGATEAMTILNSGLIGIGKTAPVAKLDIASTETITTTTISDIAQLKTLTTAITSGFRSANPNTFAITTSGTITGGSLSVRAIKADITATDVTSSSSLGATYTGINGSVNYTGTANVGTITSYGLLYSVGGNATIAAGASAYYRGLTVTSSGNLGTSGTTKHISASFAAQGTALENDAIVIAASNGASVNYGIKMEETSTATKHLLALDSQKTYFGTGEDFSIYYTGTNMVFDPELATTEIVFNESGTDTDFRIEGDTATHLFYTDSTNSRVGINTSAPGRGLEINEASGNCLRLTYNDADGSAANYADFLVSSSGDLTITPSGGDTTITGTLTTRLLPRVSTTASSATPTPNADTDDLYTVTAQAAGATFGAPTGTPVQGQALMIRIKDNGTARALAWNAIYRAIGVTLPTTTVINKTLYVGMIYNSTDTKWDVTGVAQEA
jgi:hypothetical protein